jgi:4-amino-4-deoxy-L-arabinose transferase-like glycosyltransferase
MKAVQEHRVLWLLLLATVGGAILRLWSLSNNPPSVFTDELIPFAQTLNMMQFRGPLYSWTLFNPMNLTTIGLFGEPIAILLFGPTTFAIRSSGAIYGTLLIPLSYLLCNKFFDKRVSLLSALFTATMPFAIEASRAFYMDQSNVSLVFLVLGLVLLLERNGAITESLARVASGSVCFSLVIGDFFTIYGKITAILLFAIIVYYGLRNAKSSISTRFLNYVVVPASIAFTLVVALPLLTNQFFHTSVGYFGSGDSVLYGNYNLVLDGKYLTFVSNYGAYFGPNFLIVHGDPNPAQNTGLTGELLYPCLIFTYVGIVAAFYGLRANVQAAVRGYLLLLVWLFSAPLEVAAYSPIDYVDSSGATFMIIPLAVLTALGLLLVLGEFPTYWLKIVQAFKRPHLVQINHLPEVRRRRIDRGFSLTVFVAFAASLLMFSGAYFGLPQESKVDNVSGSLGWQWSYFYGFPQVAQYIQRSGLSEDTIFVSPHGLFGGSISTFNYYYYEQHVPLVYLNYYTDGAVTSVGIANVSSFYEPKQSLIISGSTSDLNIMASEGLNLSVIFSVYRPNGALAIMLIAVDPNLQSAALSELQHPTIVAAFNSSYSTLNLSQERSVSVGYTLQASFTVAARPVTIQRFYNLAQLNAPGLNVTGLRVASASLQPGGGEPGSLTIEAYLTNTTLNAQQYWSGVALLPNVTYSVFLSFNRTNFCFGVNNYATICGISSLISIPPTTILAGSGLPILRSTIRYWNEELSVSQLEYAYYHSE